MRFSAPRTRRSSPAARTRHRFLDSPRRGRSVATRSRRYSLDDDPHHPHGTAGSATWHGPDRSSFTVVRPARARRSVQWICAVEASVRPTPCEAWDPPVHRVEGRAGVWLEEGRRDRKIRAIGLKVARSDPARHRPQRRHRPCMLKASLPCGLNADVTCRGGSHDGTTPPNFSAHGGAHFLAWRPLYFCFLHDEVNVASTPPDPEGRKLLRTEVRNLKRRSEKKPSGFKDRESRAKTTRTCAPCSSPRGLTRCAQRPAAPTSTKSAVLARRRSRRCPVHASLRGDTATAAPPSTTRTRCAVLLESVRDLDLRYDHHGRHPRRSA